MPVIDYRPINRKQFFTTSFHAAGAITLSQAASLFAQSPQREKVRIALLSDTHTPADASDSYRGFRPVENLEKAVSQMAASQCRQAIINGDAARLTGERDDYLALKGLLEPLAQQVPVIIGLGNHDNRSNFFKVFGKTPDAIQKATGKHTLVLETGPVRIVVLDSLLYVNRVAGLLGKAQRQWLAEFLQQADDRPTVLIVHHTLGDGDGDLLDVERLFRIVEPHRQVKAIFYGHSHGYSLQRRGRLSLVNLPAIGYNFADSEPVGWVEAEFTQTGLAMTLHAIGGNRAEDGKTTTVAWG